MSLQDHIYEFRRELGVRNLNPRVIVGIAVVALAILSIASYSLFDSTSAKAEDDDSQFKIVDTAMSVAESPAQKIFVHVSGSVMAPGVVTVDSGSRVADAIEAAGGFTEDAAQDALNLARELEDGEQIHVISLSEYAASLNSAGAEPGNAGNGLSQGSSSTGSSSATGLININKATSSELQTLSGIGEAKAKKIIDYREANGAFRSVDDLTNVSGIGEKTVESIRSQVCV